MTTLPLAINHNWTEYLRSRNYVIISIKPFGPTGLVCKFLHKQYDATGSIIITQSDQEDGHEWIHASIAYDDESLMPVYNELADLHRAVFGRKRYSYQLFVPESQHVSIRNNALHLYGRADGKPVTPDFTRGSGSI